MVSMSQIQRQAELALLRALAFRRGTLLATSFVAWAQYMNTQQQQRRMVVEMRLLGLRDVFASWKYVMFEARARDLFKIRKFLLKKCRRVMNIWCKYIYSEHYDAPLRYALRLHWQKWQHSLRFHIIFRHTCSQLRHRTEMCFKIWWQQTLQRLALRHVVALLRRVTDRVLLHRSFMLWPGRVLSRQATEHAARLLKRPRRGELIGAKPWSIAARHARSMKGQSVWSEARYQLRAMALHMSDGFVRCKEAVRGLLVAVLHAWRVATCKYRRIRRYGLLLRACTQLRVKSGMFYKWLVLCPVLSRRVLWISSTHKSQIHQHMPHRIALATYFELSDASPCERKGYYDAIVDNTLDQPLL